MYKDFCTKEKEHIEKAKQLTIPTKIICAEKSTRLKI
jgi:hypothetical protein